jgi:hypothetical protein
VWTGHNDLSKAYDKVNHCKLIMKMFDAGVPRDIALMFCYWFQHLYCVVEWEGIRSKQFRMLSGVRQGGICSCWLFNLYILDLVKCLSKAGLGCMFNSVFAGCLLYADDILIMSGSLVKLQKLLDFCHDYGLEHDFVFNGKKSCCIAFGNDVGVGNIGAMTLGGEEISWVSECKYLGVHVVAGKTFTTTAEESRRKFCAAFNDVILNGGFMSEECIMKVLVKQCLLILMYGARVWCVNREMKRKIGVTFNRAVRRIFGYHDYESVKHILFGFSILPIDLVIVKAQFMLMGACLRSDREVLKVCDEWQRNRQRYLDMMMEYGVDFDLSGVGIIRALWSVFDGRVGWY